ncbi:MAG: hypothetical protein AAFY65_07180 [Pseudomonadota bacterium]
MKGKTQFLLPAVPDGYSTAALNASVAQLARMAASLATTDLPRADIGRLVERLVTHSDDGPLRALLSLARSNPALDAWLVDDVFADVAQGLGHGWMEDRLSFVDVTIAATRLQDSIRRLGRFTLLDKDRESLALIVPAWEQHTLPGTLAADHLRRQGIATRLIAGCGPAELVFLIERSNPSGLLLSCGSSGSLGRMQGLVQDIRKNVARAIPIVLGGPIVDSDLPRAQAIGADTVTNDLTKALSFCGFDLPS